MTQAATEATTATTEGATATGQEPAQTTADTTSTTETTATETGAEDGRVTRANAEAARYRTERNELQTRLEQQGTVLDALRKALDPNGTTDADPTVQVTELAGRVENLTSENATLRAELLVHTIAGENGGNPVALLDSRGFLTTLQGLDPEAEDYRTKVAEAIKAAVKSNANLSAVGQEPSRGGAPDAGAGSQQPPGSVTQEQFNAMTYAQRSELFRTNPDLYRRLAG